MRLRRVALLVALRAPYVFFLTLLAFDLFFAPSTLSWCQVCTSGPNAAPDCSAYDLASALNDALGTSIRASSGSFGWISDSAQPSAPVWTALVGAQLAVFAGYVASFGALLGILLARVLPDRFKAAAAVASVVFYYACMLLACACALVYLSQALSQWGEGGGGFGTRTCARLCEGRALQPGRACRAQVTGADPRFWTGSVAASTLNGPATAEAMLALAVLGALSTGGIAALGALQVWRVCARSCRTAAGARAALLPRNLDANALGAELRRVAPGNAAVAGFIARRAAPSPAAFQCAVCWEDAAEGDMAVDLLCAGAGPGAAPHRFCPQCIAGVLLIRPACPLCGLDVRLDAAPAGGMPAAAAAAAAAAPAAPTGGAGAGSPGHEPAAAAMAVGYEAVAMGGPAAADGRGAAREPALPREPPEGEGQAAVVVDVRPDA